MIWLVALLVLSFDSGVPALAQDKQGEPPSALFAVRQIQPRPDCRIQPVARAKALTSEVELAFGERSAPFFEQRLGGRDTDRFLCLRLRGETRQRREEERCENVPTHRRRIAKSPRFVAHSWRTMWVHVLHARRLSFGDGRSFVHLLYFHPRRGLAFEG